MSALDTNAEPDASANKQGEKNASAMMPRSMFLRAATLACISSALSLHPENEPEKQGPREPSAQDLLDREELARVTAENCVQSCLQTYGVPTAEDIQRWCNVASPDPIQLEWAKQVLVENHEAIVDKAIRKTMNDFHIRASDPRILVTDFIPDAAKIAVGESVKEEVRFALRRNLPPEKNNENNARNVSIILEQK